jgi:hypothetical protein
LIIILISKGNPKDLVNVFLSLLDQSTLYLPGDIIYCDGDATYSADTRNQYLYRSPSDKYEIDLEKLNDCKGMKIS